MKKVFLLGIAAATMLASCSKDETVDVPQGKAIGFSNTFVDNATRSVNDPSYSNTNLFNNFSVYGYSNDAQIFAGDVVSNNSGSWTYQNLRYWMNDKTYLFAAVAPVDNNNIDVSNVTKGSSNVAMAITFTSNGKNDLLYAAPSAITVSETSPAPASVGLTFEHMLSKIKFSFENAVSGAYDIKVTNVTFDAKQKGTLTIADGGTKTWATDGSVTPLNFGYVVGENATTETSAAETIGYNKQGETYNEMLIIPTGTGALYKIGFTVEILSNGTTVDTYTRSALLQDFEFKPGYCYDFLAKLNYQNITGGDELKPIVFTVSTITPWTEDDAAQTVPGFGTDETGDEGDSN